MKQLVVWSLKNLKTILLQAQFSVRYKVFIVFNLQTITIDKLLITLIENNLYVQFFSNTFIT